MKTITFIFTIVLSLSLTFNATMISGQNQFKTQEEAIQKAQDNFAKLLESGIGDFGVSAENVRYAKAMSAMNYTQADFESLLQTEGLESFSMLRSTIINYVVPLALNSRIIAVVQISKSEGGWSIAGLGNAEIRDALNSLPVDVKGENLQNVIIFDIPNILSTVYVLELRAEEICFTNQGQFSLKEGAKSQEVLKFLQMEARKFQEKYGDLLKEQNLTN